MIREKFYFFFFIFLSLNLFAQRPDLKFNHISTTDGLSHNFVRSIIQDHKGFMWFATADGVNRFDGYNIKSYKYEIGKSGSLSNNDCWMLFESSDGILYVGTGAGLNIYDREKDLFTKDSLIADRNISWITEDKEKQIWVCSWGDVFYLDNFDRKFKEYNIENLAWDNRELVIDSENNFWFNSVDRGLYLLDKEKKKLVHQDVLGAISVNHIYEDKKKNLWITSFKKGLILYNAKKKTSTVFYNKSENPNSNNILCMEEDAEGNIWVGTENGGLNIFNIQNQTFYNYTNSEIDPESIGSNSIYKIFRDKNGSMWIGTYGAGVDFVETRRFAHVRKNFLDNNSLSSNHISSLQEDRYGNVWIGTDGGGLNMLDRTTGRITRYYHDPKNKNSISNNVIIDIEEDNDGNLWLGYWGGGVDLWDRRTGRFYHHRQIKNDPSSFDENVPEIYFDKRKNLWLGTSTGLFLLDRKTHKITRYTNLINEFVGSIFEDSDNNFWIGTFNGLHLFNRDTKKSDVFFHDDKDSNSLSNNKIYHIFEDSKKRLWFATAGGLNLYNKNTKSFKSYSKKDGLPNDAVTGILEDHENNLWLSTANGLCRFNPEMNTFKIFNKSDGLQGDFFKENAFLKTRSGELFFGGINGLNIINPKKIEMNTTVPSVYITDFKIFNQSITPETKNSPLEKQITETKKILLNHKQSVFSFEFAALNYKSPEKNQYAYKLTGLEDNWNYVGNKRTATYTNLDAGEYTFHVKASNNDGLWNEQGTSITIVVTPPFWRTLWFRVLILICLIAIPFNWYILNLRRIKRQNVELEEKVLSRTHELANKADELVKQKKHVERLFRELSDSIKAAQDIQNSILPSKLFIKRHLPNSFIFNKPKDLVGGDFYWFDVVNGKIIIAAIDCTGHGVSGAFMSIIGHHLLNNCVKNSSEPVAAEILNRLNEGVINELNSNREDYQIMDGMDVSLCIIDRENKILQYAGASNSLYLIRNGECIQTKGNKYSIGLSISERLNTFTNHEIKIQEGDSFYIFSDGYADQMGGISGMEKFMYHRFRQLLIRINGKKMEEQRKAIEETFQMWKGPVEQMDDILIIGFNI